MLDLIYLICLAIFLFRGFRKGLVIALFSFLSIIIGMIGALKISNSVAASLFADHPIAAKWSPLLAYIIVFFIIVWLVRIVASIIQKSLKIIALGFVNRLLGALLYGLLITLVFSIFIWLFSKMEFLSKDTLENSSVVVVIAPLAPYFFELFSGIFPFVKSSFNFLNEFFDKVNSKIA